MLRPFSQPLLERGKFCCLMLLTALLAGWSSVIQAQASFDPNSLEFERTLLEKIPESKPEKAGNSKKKSKNKSSELEVEALFVLDAQRLEGLFAEQDTSTRALVRRARVGLSKEKRGQHS